MRHAEPRAYAGDTELRPRQARQAIRPVDADKGHVRLQRRIAEQHVDEPRRVIANGFQRQTDTHIKVARTCRFDSQHPSHHVVAHTCIAQGRQRALNDLLDRQRLGTRRDIVRVRFDSIDGVHSTHGFCYM